MSHGWDPAQAVCGESRMHGFEKGVREQSPVPIRPRGCSMASFQVSDYLDDAPGHVIDQLADTILGKIRGEDIHYTDEVRDWISSPDFVRNKQPLYLQRYVGLSSTPMGESKDLSESYTRLVDAGLVESDPDVHLAWARPSRTRCVGSVSVLMKVVAMSATLDGDDIDDRLLDYCLYSQLAHISLGYDPMHKRRGLEYDEMLSRYPTRNEMESELRRMCIHV